MAKDAWVGQGLGGLGDTLFQDKRMADMAKHGGGGDIQPGQHFVGMWGQQFTAVFTRCFMSRSHQLHNE